MLKLITSVSAGVLILLILPAVVLLSGWHWQPEEAMPFLPQLYAITETITRPRGMVTTVVLGGWLLWLLRRQGTDNRGLLSTALLIIVVVWGGQGINTLIKHFVKEPRPYTVWISEATGSDTADFYRLSATERSQRVSEVTAGDKRLPGWLRQHWAFETGYSFPSGHSMFAACWALLMLAVLWPARHYKTVIATFIWAILVMWSRMALGMHWPRDVIMSVCVAGVWVILISLVRYLLLQQAANDGGIGRRN